MGLSWKRYRPGVESRSVAGIHRGLLRAHGTKASNFEDQNLMYEGISILRNASCVTKGTLR